MKYKSLSIIFLIVFYQCISLVVSNNYLFPSIIEVLQRVIELLKTPSFYMNLGYTLMHIIICLIICLILAYILSFISYKHNHIKEFIDPIITIMQSIPNISYIIIALVFTGSSQTVTLVLFLVIFPMLYHDLLEGFLSIQKELEDVIALYHPPLITSIFEVYLPLIYPSLIAGIKNAISLGIKVGVMAEIVGQVDKGVGRAINYCRINFDMSGVFAYSLILVILILIIDSFMNHFIYGKRS